MVIAMENQGTLAALIIGMIVMSFVFLFVLGCAADGKSLTEVITHVVHRYVRRHVAARHGRRGAHRADRLRNL